MILATLKETLSKSIGCHWKIDKSREIVKCRKRSRLTNESEAETEDSSPSVYPKSKCS